MRLGTGPITVAEHPSRLAPRMRSPSASSARATGSQGRDQRPTTSSSA